jgi:hypothetical protein
MLYILTVQMLAIDGNNLMMAVQIILVVLSGDLIGFDPSLLSWCYSSQV